MKEENFNYFNSQRRNEPFERKEILMLGIEIGEGEKKYLKIYNDSKPEQLAYEFCLQNNLDFDSLQELTTQIRNAFISNGIQTSSTVNNNVVTTNTNYNNTFQKENDATISQYEDRPIEEGKNEEIPIEKDINVPDEQFYKITNKENDEIAYNNNIIINENQQNNENKVSNNKRPSYLAHTLSSQSKLKLNQSGNESNVGNKSVNSTGINYYQKSNATSTSNIKRNYKAQNPNSMILNYGERLYHKGLKLQEKKEQKLSQLKSKIEEENRKNNTFRPKINRISYNALSKRYTNKLTYNDEDNIVYYKEYKDQKLSELKQKHAKDEAYSFAPSLNKRSLTMEKFRQKPSTPRYEQLYQNYRKQKLNIEDLTNQIYDKKVLFKPKVNNYQCPYTNITFEERQNYYLSKSQEKARALREQIETPSDAQTGQRLFHPEINEYERPENFNIFTNLYNESLKYKNKKLELANQFINQEKMNSSASHVNLESVELFEVKKERAFRKIFQKLDKDKDELITKVNIEVKALPPKIQEILAPIVDELKEENETLTENEFVTACYQLYETLTYPEKTEIINYGKNESDKKNNINYNFTFKPQINSYSSNIISKSSGGFKQSNIGSKRNISSSNAGSKRRFNKNEVYDVEQEHQENDEEEGEEAIDNEN